jgi:soluble lytic murein transglycosylase-like protein
MPKSQYLLARNHVANISAMYHFFVALATYLALSMSCSAHANNSPINDNQPISQASNRSAQINDIELKQFLQYSLREQQITLDKYDAEVWLESMLSRMQRYKIERDEALSILRAVYQEAKLSDIEPDLVLAVIAIESSFDRFAISPVGAQGLMQVMPFWKKEIGRNSDNLTDIAVNIRYGCKILQFYLQKSKGNLSEALARYNGSFGRTFYSEKVLVTWQRYWQSGRLSTH